MKKTSKSTKIKVVSKKNTPKKLGKKVISKTTKPAAKAKITKPAPSVKKKVASSKTEVKKVLKPVKKVVVGEKVKSTKKNIPLKSIKETKKIIVEKSVKKSAEAEVPKVKKVKVVTPEKRVIKSFEAVNEERLRKIEQNLRLGKTEPRKKPKRKKKKQKDEEEPIIENDILIEQLIASTKRLKKAPKVPKQLRTFTNPMASLTVAVSNDGNKKGASLPKKEPKGKFELEYVLHTSPGILYEFLTSPSGLSEWFADDVNIRDGIFTFVWEGSEQKAKLIGFKEEKFLRLQWLDKPDGTYFEFRIERDDLTGDISLMVVDFADEAADFNTSKLLWDSQINQLLHVIGSY